MKIKLGIDASRNRSGGAIEYLKGILNNFNNEASEISEIHIWSYSRLLDILPDFPWLIKHRSKFLDRGLFFQLIWQLFYLPKNLKKYNCDFLFTSDAASICYYKKSIVLSQDILAYDENYMAKLGWGKDKLRLISIFYLQNFSFRRAKGVIFLTEYSKITISKYTGELNNTICIPHATNYSQKKLNYTDTLKLKSNIKILYVSPFFEYKNQLNLVKSINYLHDKYPNISLHLVGDYDNNYGRNVLKHVNKMNSKNKFIFCYGKVDHENILEHLISSDVFIFPSSCETFGIALLEAMAVGLPILSSSSSSLTETLKNSALYFNPIDPNSISIALEILLNDDKLRIALSKKAIEMSQNYTWEKTSKDTFEFLINTYKNFINANH